MNALRDATTIAFPGQVVLVHGDSHYFKVDKPINLPSGRCASPTSRAWRRSAHGRRIGCRRRSIRPTRTCSSSSRRSSRRTSARGQGVLASVRDADGREARSSRRRLADSNCCKRLCRPLPNHSAKAPCGRIVSTGVLESSDRVVAGTNGDRARPGGPRAVRLRGVSTPSLVVARAEGARIWDVDGNEYIDFAGGIGCANLGHSPPAVVDAVHAQVDRYLHQCFMVGMYEPYVDVCRRLAELSPCRGDRAEVDPGQQRRRGDRERRQDRAHRDRPAGRDRLRQRLPRPDAADDDDDREGRALQEGLRPVRARGLPHARSVRVPRDHRGRRDRRAEAALQGRRRPGVGGVRRARAGAGRGRLHPDDARLPEAPAGAARRARDPLRERRDPERRRAHRPGLGDRALRHRARPARQRARRSAAGSRSPRSPAAPS